MSRRAGVGRRHGDRRGGADSAAEAGAAGERFVEFLSRHELSHFAKEESVLLPALDDSPTARALEARVRTDHEFLRAALLRMRGAQPAADLNTVHEVGQRLRAHVRMEERELFPYIERKLSPEALERLGTELD